MKVRVGLAAVAAWGCSLWLSSSAANAWEAGYAVNALPGISIGLPMGANPPPGFYYVNYANYSTGVEAKGGGAAFGLPPGTKADIASNVSQFIWSTPYQILGGSVLMFVAVPVADASIYNGSTTFQHFTGMHNIVLSPANVSWNLGGGLFGMVGLEIATPTGTLGSTPFGNDLGNAGAPYWTIEPKMALSYLADGYNLTALLRYGINTQNTASRVTNGSYLNLELTATKKFGKWEFGPVGYFSAQVTPDKNCPPIPTYCARGSTAGLGGLIGYDFGPLVAHLTVTESVLNNNGFDGLRVWTQFIVPLSADAPPPPKPAAKKL
jgi:hypothetical protein